MHIKYYQFCTYHRAPILDQAVVENLGPHNNLSHYRDSRLCTMASNPTHLGPPIVGPNQHTLHKHHLPSSDVEEYLVAQDPQHHCSHSTGI